MAFFDDPKLLTAHLRHSFITSDDSGMCELVMINEDLEKEIKTDRNFSKRSVRLAQRYNPSEQFPRYAAKSYDIYASPSMPRRPPLKNDANMFEILEKKKSKSSQMKSVTWNSENVTYEPGVFVRQDVVKKPKDSGPSHLAMLLAEQSKLAANPFFEYGKFNGENHGAAVTNTYRIFLAMSKTPLKPIVVTVLHTATVSALIGLTLWKYVEETQNPVKLKPVRNYSLRIAEEDGDIDTDLPELEKEDRVAKFRFKYLGLIEIKRKAKMVDPQQAVLPRRVVKVYYEQGGFSTLAIDDLNIDAGEILARVIRKRCLQIHGYELERKDAPGVSVDPNATLRTLKTLEFVLVKNQGKSRASSESREEPDLPDVKDELTFYQYKSYNILLVNKVRANSEVILGVSGDRIEVEPVSQTKTFLSRSSKSQKPMTYEVKKICACEIVDDKNPAKTLFRITRKAKDGSGYKTMDFEAPLSVAREIIRKLNLILDGVSGGARSDYMEYKELNKGKKISKS